VTLARTNYSYGKRLRELAKKQKREEKIQKRKERKEAAAAGLAPVESAEDAALADEDAEGGGEDGDAEAGES